MFRIVLTDAQRAALRQRTRDPRLRPRGRDRLEMIRLNAAGWSVPRIAQHLGVHAQTVRRYVHAYLDRGWDGLTPRPQPGRPPRVTTADLAALEHQLAIADRSWTAPQLVAWLQAERQVSVCRDHLARLLRRRGFRWKRTQQSVAHKRCDPHHLRTAQNDLAALKKPGA
jgi:transposase